VPLQPDPKVRDQALGRLAQELGQREGGDGLHHHGGADNGRDRSEQPEVAFPHDVVDQILGRAGKHKTGQAVDQDQEEPRQEHSAARPDQLAHVTEDGRRLERGLRAILGFSFHTHF
jgi:hypothetical protein